MKLNELNGWQRLHILGSILYLVAVIFYASSFFPEKPVGIDRKILDTFIDNNKEIIEKRRINSAVNEIKKFLKAKNKDSFDRAGLKLYGIEIYEVIDLFSDPLSLFPEAGRKRIIKIERYGIFEYPIGIDANEIIESLKDNLDKNLNTYSVQEIKSKYSNIDDLSSHFYDNINDYSTTDDFKKEYNVKYFITMSKYFIKYFCVLIIPIIVVYIFGWSIGWVIGGFKKE